jgi:hypothetical protein
MNRARARGDTCGMNARASNDVGAVRGASRLLAHCARLSRSGDDRPSARARVEAELGLELARLLVDALASGPRRVLV